MNKAVYLFSTFTAVVVTLIIVKNPKLFSKSPLFDTDIKTEQSYLRPTVQWQTIDPLASSFTTHDIFSRGDVQRLGQATWNQSNILKVAWTLKNINVGIHGASKASPVADDSGIYVGSDSSWFYAINHDGSVRWKFFVAESNRGIHSTAAIDQQNVYFGTYSGQFYCLSKATGALIWSRKFGDTFGSSPLIFENSLILAVETFKPDGFVVRIDKNTGAAIWLSEFLGEQSHSSPAIDIKSRQVFLGANNATFFSLDLDNGSLRWKVPIAGHMKGTPVVVDDGVFFSDWGSEFSRLDVATGRLKWKFSLKGISQASASYLPGKNGFAIADKAGYLSIISKDGKLMMQKDLNVSSMMSSPVTLLGKTEKILITCEKKALCILDSDGNRLSKIDLDGVLTGIPFVYKNVIYVAVNQGSLYAIRAEDLP